MKKVILYTTKTCDRCRIIKDWLKKSNIPLGEKDLEDLDVMTELVMANVSLFSAPIVLANGNYYSSFEMEDLKQFLEAS